MHRVYRSFRLKSEKGKHPSTSPAKRTPTKRALEVAKKTFALYQGTTSVAPKTCLQRASALGFLFATHDPAFFSILFCREPSVHEPQSSSNTSTVYKPSF
jgi:hypothetical protein